MQLQRIEIDVVRKGSGQPLVMLHGGGGPVSAMPFADRLAESYEIIAPVHPGFSGSAIPDDFDRVDDLAFLYLDLLDELRLEDVILMGFSMGGWTALELATMNSSRIAKLVLVDPVGVKVGGREDRDIADVFALPADELKKRLYHDPANAPDLARMTDEQLQIAASNRTALAVYTWDPYMHNPKLPQRLHRIRIPTHFIWGANDGVVTVDYGRAFCSMIDGAGMTVIEDAGHAPQVEQPGAFVEAVQNFLATASRD